MAGVLIGVGDANPKTGWTGDATAIKPSGDANGIGVDAIGLAHGVAGSAGVPEASIAADGLPSTGVDSATETAVAIPGGIGRLVGVAAGVAVESGVGVGETVEVAVATVVAVTVGTCV